MSIIIESYNQKCIFCTRSLYRKKSFKLIRKNKSKVYGCSMCIKEISNISLKKGYMYCLVCSKYITNCFSDKHNKSKLHIKNVLRGIKIEM